MAITMGMAITSHAELPITIVDIGDAPGSCARSWRPLVHDLAQDPEASPEASPEALSGVLGQLSWLFVTPWDIC